MQRNLITVVLLILPLLAGAEERLVVGDFSAGSLAGWEEASFEGHTLYRIVEANNGKVLRAATDGEASGLFKEMEVDLSETPWMNWSWKITDIFANNDEKTKAGDDYAARVYVVVSGGVFFWQTRAINYVWASHEPRGSHWPNAFTDNARMVAVRSGDKKSGTWISEKRNVREDFKRLFGEDVDTIDAVAVMVDGDNTGQVAESFFGDIYFTAD